ncbi:MAG: NAD(P)H-binding protein [Pseudomonadales bacterium]
MTAHTATHPNKLSRREQTAEPDQQMFGKTALVVGATGVTGHALLECLLTHPNYSKVIAFSRRPMHLDHPRLTVHVVDFDHVDRWANLLRGDELFSALGTTLKLAGSKQAQYKVDFSYQLAIAEAARANDVQRLFLVSSPGANPDTRNFYLRVKGELDHAVQELCFDHCVLIKPSLIEANRPDSRPGEKIAGIALRKLASAIPPLRRLQPITAQELASAIVSIAQHTLEPGRSEYQLDDLFDFVEHTSVKPERIGEQKRRRSIRQLQR